MQPSPYAASTGASSRWASGPQRPTYREAYPISGGSVVAGIGATVLWFALFALVGWDGRSRAWLVIGAGIAAWLAATLLTRFGDRGVAVGVAVTTALTWSVTSFILAVVWATDEWLLW